MNIIYKKYISQLPFQVVCYKIVLNKYSINSVSINALIYHLISFLRKFLVTIL